jgi:XTP/dITP diphosphohydrolase
VAGTKDNGQLTTLKLYLASANPGKLREFRGAAAARGIALEAVPGIESLPPCHEDGPTFEANARKKALHYSAYVDGLVFADDSGICVEALGGAPGILSARFAGAGADDAANNQKLLAELHLAEASKGTACPGLESRTARYVCAIALAERRQIVTVVEGHVEGLVLDVPRGCGGFGYDPFFFYPPQGKTFAELSPEDKSAVSHRGEAFRKLLDFLAQQ